MAAVVLAAPSLARAERPRPDDVPAAQVVTAIAPNELQIYNDYASPSRVYLAQGSVVHYVVAGVDAPPLNDDDGDAVPDYVERVGAAADTAIAYFLQRGFAAIRPDEAGPDTRPDVYISRFAPGYFGISFPAPLASGGAFVVVSNMLDPSPERSLGSLYGAVAHELFHLVQFSYFPSEQDSQLPAWVLEGSAAAIESSVCPQLDDTVSALQLRSWFEAPQRSMTEQSYGSQLFWRYLEEHDPHVLPAFLASIGGSRPRSFSARLATIHARLARRPIAATFGDFATAIAGRYPSRIRPLSTLAAGGQVSGSVAPLAIHYLRLARSVHSVRLQFFGKRGEVALTYELASIDAGHASVTHRLRARHVGGRLVFTIPPTLLDNPRLGPMTLVIANGHVAAAATYTLSVH